MVVSPDLQPEQALYKVTVALRLVDRMLADLDVGATELAAQALIRDASQPTVGTQQRGELTGRVAHALQLAEMISSDAAGQLRSTLRGVLLDLERRAPQPVPKGSKTPH